MEEQNTKNSNEENVKEIQFKLVEASAITELEYDTTDREMTEALSDPYVVYLCNRCNWVATHIKDESGRLTELRPPIGRTCNADRQTCFNEGRFAPLLTSNCDSRAFNIALRVRHPRGIVGDTGFVTVQPDCRYTGVVFYLEIPDPA